MMIGNNSLHCHFLVAVYTKNYQHCEHHCALIDSKTDTHNADLVYCVGIKKKKGLQPGCKMKTIKPIQKCYTDKIYNHQTHITL